MLKALLPPRLLVGLGIGIAVFIISIFTFVKAQSPAKFAGCLPQNARNYFDPSQTTAFWQDQNINPLLGLKSKLKLDDQKVLGIQSQDKSIDIDLNQKKLTARQGDTLILETDINIGKFQATPVGEFSISVKHLSVDLAGGSHLSNTYFYLPNVPYALYFQQNFAIMGSYWSKSYGADSGFGCIEVPLDKAEILFYWADVPSTSSTPGTKINIHYQ